MKEAASKEAALKEAASREAALKEVASNKAAFKEAVSPGARNPIVEPGFQNRVPCPGKGPGTTRKSEHP